MTSVNKKKKQKNAYGVPAILKENDGFRIKRFLFYTSSWRRKNKKIKLEDTDD